MLGAPLSRRPQVATALPASAPPMPQRCWGEATAELIKNQQQQPQQLQQQGKPLK